MYLWAIYFAISAHIKHMNRRISALAAILITVALLVTLFGNFFGEPLISFADVGEKVIYLTFDDGPSSRVTPKILDVLKKEKVPATFFIVGAQAKNRKAVLKRAFEEGHTLAIHSYSHKYKEIYSSPEALIKDIEKCNEIICSVTGEFSSVYRFPGGSFSVGAQLLNTVKAEGYKYVDWNASFRDSEIKNATAQELYCAAVATVANPKKIIMLAHDSTDKSETVEALKKVIKHFKEKGYEFKKF